MTIWLVHFQFYFTGSKSRNILILLWTQSIAGLTQFLLHWNFLIQFSNIVKIYTDVCYSDSIDSSQIGQITLKIIFTKTESLIYLKIDLQ